MAADRLACHHMNTLTRVLIVDDHPSFRATARALLQAEGFDVIGEAEDGVSALKQAKELHPDVVLTSSRDGSDFGPLVAQSGARGFIAKGELSGAALKAVLG
jgi:response regulator RpfG family c-di-GMP phosphodiesterase